MRALTPYMAKITFKVSRSTASSASGRVGFGVELRIKVESLGAIWKVKPGFEEGLSLEQKNHLKAGKRGSISLGAQDDDA